MEDEEESSTPSLICPGRAVMSVTPAAPSVVSMTPEVLPLASPPPAAAPTLSRSSSPLVSPPPKPVVQRVRVKKRKATERIEGAAKRTKSIKNPVINLDVYEELKEMEEEAEKEGDDQKLRDITCVKKGLMWIGEADGEENSIELWERRIARVRYSTVLPHLLLFIIFISHVYYICYFLLSMYGHQGNAGTLSHVISVNYRKR